MLSTPLHRRQALRATKMQRKQLEKIPLGQLAGHALDTLSNRLECHFHFPLFRLYHPDPFGILTFRSYYCAFLMAMHTAARPLKWLLYVSSVYAVTAVRCVFHSFVQLENYQIAEILVGFDSMVLYRSQWSAMTVNHQKSIREYSVN